MQKIESVHNETFKKYFSLTASRGLKKEGCFLLSGEKLIAEFMQKPYHRIAAEILTKGLTGLSQATQIELTDDLFDQIDVLGTHFNILVLEMPKLEKISEQELLQHKPKGIEVVLPTGDPGNCGALIRSCEAFGVSRIVLAAEAAHPFLPKAIKASAGSVLRIPMVLGPALKCFPPTCIALDKRGVSLYDFKWPQNALLVVGEEGMGLGQSPFKPRVSIPTQKVESLNAVVAASIALAFRASKI